MKTLEKAKSRRSESLLLSILFMLCASLIYYFFVPWGSSQVLAKIPDYLAKISVGILLLILTFLARRNHLLQRYWRIIFALFILHLTISLTKVFGIYMIKELGVLDTTPSGWAFQKLNEAFIASSVIIACTLTSGDRLGSIYIQKGNLKLGLLIGIITFVLAAVGSFPMATLFNAQNLTIQRVIPWIPWILIFVLSNGLMEELLFRGLFFKKLEPFVGKFLSNLMIALVFTLLHGLSTYSVDQMLFLFILFPLALMWGYIMQKTDSIWGSVLFHAGMDIPIMLSIFSNL